MAARPLTWDFLGRRYTVSPRRVTIADPRGFVFQAAITQSEYALVLEAEAGTETDWDSGEPLSLASARALATERAFLRALLRAGVAAGIASEPLLDLMLTPEAADVFRELGKKPLPLVS